MTNIEDQLRNYYADRPIDTAAEVRIGLALRAAAPAAAAAAADRPAPARRWLAVAAGVAVVAGVATATATLGDRQDGAPSAASPQADMVSLTPQSTVQQVIEQLGFKSSEVQGLGGTSVGGTATTPECVGGHFDLVRADQSSSFEVTVGIPNDGAPTIRCGIPDADSPNTAFSQTDNGGKLAVTTTSTKTTAAWSVFLLRSDNVFVAVQETTSLDSPAATKADLISLVQSGDWETQIPASDASRNQALFTPKRFD